MVIGELTLVGAAKDSTAHPAHQSHISGLDGHSLGVDGQHIRYYNNMLVKIVMND